METIFFVNTEMKWKLIYDNTCAYIQAATWYSADLIKHHLLV